MHIGRILSASLTAVALLMAGGGSVLCTPASSGVMACCKSAQPCGPGMKQADCCRFVPASPGHAPAAVETTLQPKVSRDEVKGATLAGIAAIDSSPEAEIAPQASPPPLLQRKLSVPLYLLNASLLR